MRRLSVVLAVALLPGVLFAQSLRRAPGFSLPDLKGNEHDLQDYRGKIVLLDIMRTDCPHCAPFAQVLEEIKAHYRGKVGVLAIVNPPDNQTTVGRFVAQRKITYPILFDCGQAAYSYILPDAMRPEVSVPHIYLIDAGGMIRGDWAFGPATSGIFEGRGLYTEIDKLLGVKSASMRTPQAD
jgi:peroxiredoxin